MVSKNPKEKRDYTRERLNESPERKQQRSDRNKARRLAEKKFGAAAIKGKDIDHKRPMRKGGTTTAANIRVSEPSSNRAWRAGKRNYD